LSIWMAPAFMVISKTTSNFMDSTFGHPKIEDTLISWPRSTQATGKVK
jgi:hypothetical protein